MKINNKTVNAIEVHPLLGLNDKVQTVDNYKDATAFEPALTPEDEQLAVCYGVFAHFEGGGLESLFDCVDKENAEKAEQLLNHLLNL